jgi:hypothetical protein
MTVQPRKKLRTATAAAFGERLATATMVGDQYIAINRRIKIAIVQPPQNSALSMYGHDERLQRVSFMFSSFRFLAPEICQIHTPLERVTLSILPRRARILSVCTTRNATVCASTLSDLRQYTA